jgi:hypothetical protein
MEGSAGHRLKHAGGEVGRFPAFRAVGRDRLLQAFVFFHEQIVYKAFEECPASALSVYTSEQTSARLASFKNRRDLIWFGELF